MSPVSSHGCCSGCSAPCRKGGEGAGAEPHEVRGEPRVKCTLVGWQGLTEVGELHSLTDWQVSDASEDAELEDFCCAVTSREPEGERRGS